MLFPELKSNKTKAIKNFLLVLLGEGGLQQNKNEAGELWCWEWERREEEKRIKREARSFHTMGVF